MELIGEYLEQVDEKRREAFERLYRIVKENLPEGFEEVKMYGMISFVVPLERYPDGYLNRMNEPLPFISLASQKNHIAIYHMGIMGNESLLTWFQEAYAQQVPTKLNMGKSCIRLTNPKHIPYDLIVELVQKMTVDEWIAQYERFKGC
ncbi:DUF1801 domain-containing protein [Vagococcus zengguangii]|uniref:DUF1801 domain-containing protein n=1 Tax=Vagococcus zengguangii TaxID=2571750 RepID=A0A4D7CT47_9ENTE|nr:DUF1801 domain-containing protein [Vagococcus zengguangii]QCI85962.1 DUF1801 domain-containing protein [Vagococcus zengguangii]TLG80293.1 DUF1801 domain-containing protein [Vagococcus zengguangii]